MYTQTQEQYQMEIKEIQINNVEMKQNMKRKDPCSNVKKYA